MRILSAKIPFVLTLLVLCSLVGLGTIVHRSEADWADRIGGLAMWATGAGVAALLWAFYGIVCLCTPSEAVAGAHERSKTRTLQSEIEHNRHCIDPCHSEHLCYMEATAVRMIRPDEYRNKMSQAQYEALMDDPQFECDYCGRVAHAGRNLCTPVRLQTKTDGREDS